jgi:hypothetical protein
LSLLSSADSLPSLTRCGRGRGSAGKRNNGLGDWSGCLDRLQVPGACVVDQGHPVAKFLLEQAPFSAGAASSFGRSRRGLHDSCALAGEDVIECAGELSIAVSDEEPEGADPIGDVHDKVADLLGAVNKTGRRGSRGSELIEPIGEHGDQPLQLVPA